MFVLVVFVELAQQLEVTVLLTIEVMTEELEAAVLINVDEVLLLRIELEVVLFLDVA